ncbi:MAG TPA: ABC transporter permease, partial [Chloroflexi bacterium]|nr:ABC transporter permease [Chloroflexota bacterium]
MAARLGPGRPPLLGPPGPHPGLDLGGFHRPHGPRQPIGGTGPAVRHRRPGQRTPLAASPPPPRRNRRPAPHPHPPGPPVRLPAGRDGDHRDDLRPSGAGATGPQCRPRPRPAPRPGHRPAGGRRLYPGQPARRPGPALVGPPPAGGVLVTGKTRIALAWLLLTGLAVGLLPSLLHLDPLATDPQHPLAPPSPAHPLGTDLLGRDLLVRLLYGGRWTLGVGLLAAALATLPGVLLGLLSGFYEGVLDELIGRGMDLLLAFPHLLLALGVVALLGPGMGNIALATGLTGLPGVVRVVRSATRTVSRQPYILAARAVGVGHLRLLRRYLLPNVAGPVLVMATLQLGWAILNVSALSFLGLGPPLGTPEWGAMLNEGRTYLRTAPWIAVAPGLALSLTVLAVNLLGDGLQEAADPRRPAGGRPAVRRS